MMAGHLRWAWLGRVAHAGAAALQERLRERVIAGDAGAAALLLCEHEPVITLGRGADRAHVVAPGRTPVVRTGRGGGVTYHGPGQLMVYPLLDLRRAGLGVRELVTALEQSVVDLAADYGLSAASRCDAPGAHQRRGHAAAAAGRCPEAAAGVGGTPCR